MCVSTDPCPPVCISHFHCPESTEFQGAHHAWEFRETQSQVQGKYITSTTEYQVREPTATAGHTFHSNQNWL